MMTRSAESDISALPQDRVLVIYGRENCHLCQDMVLALRQWQQRIVFDFHMIDIDSDQDLIARYGERIPVLVAPSANREICHYFLDTAALDDYLGKFR